LCQVDFYSAVVEYKSNLDYNTVAMLFGKQELFLGKQGKNNGETITDQFLSGKSGFHSQKTRFVEYPPQIRHFPLLIIR
jgi:hypothetical protein